MAGEETVDRASYDEAYQEGQKLFFEAFKHVTTLSTGAILILVALLEKLFKSPQGKGFIVATFIGLILATVSSVIAMFMISYSVSDEGNPSNFTVAVGSLSLTFAVIGFFGGIISLVIFALKNFYALQ